MPTMESFYAIVFRVFVCYLAFLGSFSRFFSMYFSRYFLKVHFVGFSGTFLQVFSLGTRIQKHVSNGS